MVQTSISFESMGKTFRGREKDYLKDKYLREQQKRNKRQIKEEKNKDEREDRDSDADLFY